MSAGVDVGRDDAPGEQAGAEAQGWSADVLAAAADYLTDVTVPRLESRRQLKEKDLSAAVKECVRAHLNEEALTRKVSLAEWGRVGPVDIVVFGDGAQRPRHVMELKWCQSGVDKVHEAVWDLFKVALLGRFDTTETALLLTGAPVEIWDVAFCRDLFEAGRFSSEELCDRTFPTGGQRLLWDWLLEGGNDSFPTSVPDPIETRVVGRWPVMQGGEVWEIRAVSVHPGDGDVAFFDGWPRGDRPERARRPLESGAVEASSQLEAPELPPVSLGPRFDEAVSLARTLHFGHARKGTSVPYLSHLLAVCALVLEDGGDEDETIAALLHDTVEDQGGHRRLDQIRQLFGDRVAGIVEACSDTDVEPKPPWRDRKERYLEHLRRTERHEVLRVSLADKLHNARTILADLRERGSELWSRFTTGSAKDQLWYYGGLADVYEERLPGRMTRELRRTVEELERLAAPAEMNPRP